MYRKLKETRGNKKLEQVTINFDASPIDCYESCREYIAALTHQQGRPQKAIAADMDYSPSDLSRKLSQAPDDSRRFTLDDLERWVAVNKDCRPLFYLIQKHAVEAKSRDELQAELDRLTKRLESMGTQ